MYGNQSDLAAIFVLIYKFSFYFVGMLGSPFAAMGLAGLTGHFGGLPTSLASLGFPGGLGGVSSQQAAAALAAVAHHHQAAAAVRGGAGSGGLGCVLLVSNLNETETEPDHLFILFGVYGDVQVSSSH